jgi:hypothetical protein
MSSSHAMQPAPVALFQGYNSVTGEGKSTAVKGKSQNAGAVSTTSCSVCKTITDLEKSLQISQSLSASYLGVASVDEKVNFFSSLKVTTFGLYVVVYASHVTGSETLTDVSFLDGVAIPSASEGVANFAAVYGDSFLSSVTTGGEYSAVYVFHSETEEEQNSLEASLHASGVYDGISASVDLSTKMTEFCSTTTVQWQFQQRCSGIKNPKLPIAGDIGRFAIDFPSLVLDSPGLIEMNTTGYESVLGAGAAFDPIRNSRTYFTGGEFTDGVIPKLGQMVQIHNQMNLIQSIYDSYTGYRDQPLMSAKAVVESDIAKIKNQMNAYCLNPAQTFTEPQLPSLDSPTRCSNAG